MNARHAAMLLLSLSMPIAALAQDDDFEAKRRELQNKPRMVIYDNDGNDAYCYPKDLEFSLENFLELRTTPLKGSAVTTIAYCTLTSAFGQFTYRTKVGEFINWPTTRPNDRSIVPDLEAMGTDCLAEIVKFCRANNYEVFWADRFNDCHDFTHKHEAPHYRWSKFKDTHPELLFGKEGERMSFGRWTAVDFNSPIIRDRFVSFFKEVAEMYDLDGVQIDFFRHFYVFPEVAKGGEATEGQCALITEMMRNVRVELDKLGQKRGRPYLIMVRVPDNFDYCRRIGVDMDAILKDKLVDAIIGTGYFQMDTWSHWAEIGKQYGVRTYASLSESRVQGTVEPFKRDHNLVFRARAATALAHGVYGIHVFNQFKPKTAVFDYVRELNDLDNFFSLNKLYIPVILDNSPNMYLNNGARFSKTQIFNPSHPQNVKGEWTLKLETGEKKAPALLVLYVRRDKAEPFAVKLNGVAGECVKTKGDIDRYLIPVEAFRLLDNEISFIGDGKIKDVALEVVHDRQAPDRIKF